VRGLGLRVSGSCSEFRVYGLGFSFENLRFGVWGFGVGDPGFGV